MCDETNDVGEAGTPDGSPDDDANSATVRHGGEESDRPAVMIVEAVSAATGRPTAELPPLQETIDTDALNALLNGQPSAVTVSFRYAGTVVSVSGNDTVEVRVDADRPAEGDE
jgi:hypothetical protein